MFNFSFDRRTIFIIVAVMLGIAVIQLISSPEALFGLLLSAPGVLLAITFHEYAHGFAAYKLGDTTAKDEGRLSLNPFAHLDPIGTVMLLVAGFGWGKPVHVNPRNYTRKMSMDKADAIVSAAGPLVNFVLALILTLVYCAIYKFVPASFIMSTVGSIIVMLVYYAISINIGLGVFNLIPLPPLDGSKIIRPILPQGAKNFLDNNEQIFYIIFIIIWISGIASSFISPAMAWITQGFMNLGGLIFGL